MVDESSVSKIIGAWEAAASSYSTFVTWPRVRTRNVSRASRAGGAAGANGSIATR